MGGSPPRRPSSRVAPASRESSGDPLRVPAGPSERPRGAGRRPTPSGDRLDEAGQSAFALEGTRVSNTIGEVERWARARSLLPILGVDEVGKGPLAGPVVAGACILPVRHGLVGIRDSKQLTEAAREALFPAIQAVALGLGVGVVEASEIDRIGLQPATYAAMRVAIQAALVGGHTPALVVVDGKLAIPGLELPQKTFVKGDDRSYAIAAASILAKVTRDRLMVEYDREFPGYGFAQHKGYGTAAHRAGLRAKGPSPIHRLSFRLLADD